MNLLLPARLDSVRKSAGIRLFLGCLICLSIILGTTATSWAQDDVQRPKAVDLLPERTSLYVQIDDVKQLVEDLQESNFGKMLQDERIAPLVEELFGEAQKAFDNLSEEEELGFSLSEILSLPAGEICFAIITPRREFPKFALIMDVPEDSDIAQRLIDRVREEAEEDDAEFSEESIENIPYHVIRGNDDDEHVHYVLHQGTLVACNSQEVFEEMMTRWVGTPPEKDRTLAGNRKFVTIMNKCKSTEDLPMTMSFFVDPLMLARGFTVKEPGAKLFFAALPTLGLDGLSAIGGSALFNEKNYESIFHGHLLLTNPRAGVIEMIALRPGFYEPESFVSAEMVTYATSSWDFRKFMAELETIVDAFTGDGTFQKQIDENINEELGINFQEDVLNNLAGRVTYLQWIGEKATLDGQCNAMAIQVEDIDKAKEFVESILDRVAEEEGNEDEMPIEDTHEGITFWHAPSSFEEQRRQAQRRRRERRREQGEEVRDDEDRTRLKMVETVPCFAFIEDNFVFCGNIDFMKHMIETHNGEHDLLADDDEYRKTIKEIRTLMDGNLPSMFSYSRPDRSLKMLYEVLLSDNTKDVVYENAEDNQFLQVLSDLLEDNDLPPFEELAAYFPPQGAFVVNDETGFHMLAFQRKAKLEDTSSK